MAPTCPSAGLFRSLDTWPVNKGTIVSAHDAFSFFRQFLAHVTLAGFKSPPPHPGLPENALRAFGLLVVDFSRARRSSRWALIR